MLVQYVIGELGLGKGLSKCHTNRDKSLSFLPKNYTLTGFIVYKSMWLLS